MDFKLYRFLLIIPIIIQLAIAIDSIANVKYPKNEFNSNDSTQTSPGNTQFDLKKDNKKDLKKEFVIKEIQNENLKLFIKDSVMKESVKNSLKDNLPQRDNSKATSQKEDKFEKHKNIASLNKEQPAQLSNKETITKNQTHATVVADEPHLDLADLFIGTITGTSKMADTRPSNSTKTSSNSTKSGTSSTLDDLRIKVIQQVHLKAQIFFQVFSQTLSGNQLLRESLKNKNDGIANKISSIYSSTPHLRPFQASTRPPANSNNWCASMSNSFAQYAQLNAFLLAAFLLFPVTIPFYLLGWLILFLTRAIFCVGAKQILTNIIYRIRSS